MKLYPTNNFEFFIWICPVTWHSQITCVIEMASSYQYLDPYYQYHLLNSIPAWDTAAAHHLKLLENYLIKSHSNIPGLSELIINSGGILITFSIMILKCSRLYYSF